MSEPSYQCLESNVKRSGSEYRLNTYVLAVGSQTSSKSVPFFVIGIQIEMNAFLTFDWTTADYTPVAFPQYSNCIAIYFSDVGEICGSKYYTGAVYYRLESGNIFIR